MKTANFTPDLSTNERMTSENGNRRAPICTKVGTRPDGQRDSARRQDDPDPGPGL